MTKPKASQSTSSSIPGLAVIGCMLTGLFGFWFAFEHEQGMGLLASAVAFGALVFYSFNR